MPSQSPSTSARVPTVGSHGFVRRLPLVLACLLVAVLTLVTFQRALSAGFINLDDDLYVSANEHVQHGLTPSEIGWAWTSNYLGYDIPLTWMSYMLDSELFGNGPWGYHLTNIVLHACNAVLLLLVLQRATGSLWRAALAAALWAVHPLRVESVAWVTERKDVLAGFFALATLYGYVRYAQSSRRYWLAAAIVGFCLSLLSKPPLAAALPVSLWLLDYWPLGRVSGGPDAILSGNVPLASRAESRRQGRGSAGSSSGQRRSALRLAIEKWPFFTVAIAAGVILAVGMKRAAILAGDVTVSWPGKLQNAIVAPIRSLEREVWFTHLAVVYPMPAGWPLAPVLVAAAILLTVTVLVVWQRKRFPWLAVGWFWFLINFAPSVGLVQAGLKVAMGDRYAYFPSIGLLLMLVWSIPENWVQTFRRRAMAGIAVAGCLAALIAFTCKQLSYWQDSVSIFRHAVAVTNDNWMAHHDLAIGLFDRGENDEALAHFNRSIEINPNYPLGWENRGRLRFTMGDYAKSLEDADQAVLLEPESIKAHWVREFALMKLGRFQDAAEECKSILKLDPESVNARKDIALAFSKLGKDPLTLLNAGRYRETVGACQQLLALDPRFPDANNKMAFALFKLGRRDEAIFQLREAVRLDPNDAAARENLDHMMEEARHLSAGTPAGRP